MAVALLLPLRPLGAQTETNSEIPSPGEMSQQGVTNAPSDSLATNTPPAVPETPAAPEPPPAPPAPTLSSVPPTTATTSTVQVPPRSILGTMLTLASLAGFVVYYCGLSRAKNTAHTPTLILVGVLFALTGYWIGGFAVQTGGIGDAHAALSQSYLPAEMGALNHELEWRHWGFMGSSGFFLAVDDSARNGVAVLFLIQASMLVIAVAAALGAALERGKLLAMAFCAYLVGVFVYPLVANWAWGGGWLAALGREFGMGVGFIDIGGSGVVHETAGVLALVIAIVLGPRHGRFGRNQTARAIPGHNVPFIVAGCTILLISWITTNGFAGASLVSSNPVKAMGLGTGIAAANTLLAATGGMIVAFAWASAKKRRPEPALLCRGILGGAVASCASAALIDPWAAFLTGGVAAIAVQGTMTYLERVRIDDPAGATAVHGAAGAWGVLATGLFANGSEGIGLNGVDGPVRGLFFGGAWHQLLAQVIGCVAIFVAVYALGYACVSLVQKILGNRADLDDETAGLDLPELGALGYQPDVEHENGDAKS